jgi:Virulence factor BrkB
VGAAVTAVLFTLGKFLISFYIGRSAVASSFGAAGSLAVVMIWVYYSAQIFLLGAEFTWVYAHSHGSRKGQLRPGELERVPLAEGSEPTESKPVAAPVRIAPAPLPPMPQHVAVHKRNPVVTFGIAAAIGALAGVLLRVKPGLSSHLKLR